MKKRIAIITLALGILVSMGTTAFALGNASNTEFTRGKGRGMGMGRYLTDEQREERLENCPNLDWSNMTDEEREQAKSQLQEKCEERIAEREARRASRPCCSK